MSSNSVSLRKAQVPISCHFCNEQAIHWKCVNCDVFICTSCEGKIHRRLKPAKDHEIVSVSEIWKDNTTQREVASEVITSVFNIYTTIVPVIHSVVCYGKDFIYFIFNRIQEKSRFKKGKMLKSSIQILQTLERQLLDITVTVGGKILFIDMILKNICGLTHSGEIKTAIDTFPMLPMCLHVNKDNELIAGLNEPGQALPATDFVVRQVVIFDKCFKRKATLELDTKGRKCSAILPV